MAEPKNRGMNVPIDIEHLIDLSTDRAIERALPKFITIADEHIASSLKGHRLDCLGAMDKRDQEWKEDRETHDHDLQKVADDRQFDADERHKQWREANAAAAAAAAAARGPNGAKMVWGMGKKQWAAVAGGGGLLLLYPQIVAVLAALAAWLNHMAGK